MRMTDKGYKQKIEKLLKAGLFIQAIKVYREWKDCELKEAKEAIDLMKATVSGGGE